MSGVIGFVGKCRIDRRAVSGRRRPFRVRIVKFSSRGSLELRSRSNRAVKHASLELCSTEIVERMNPVTSWSFARKPDWLGYFDIPSIANAAPGSARWKAWP
jgi:hypothetical protein